MEPPLWPLAAEGDSWGAVQVLKLFHRPPVGYGGWGRVVGMLLGILGSGLRAAPGTLAPGAAHLHPRGLEPWTYIGDTEEGQQESGQHNEEREELAVSVQQPKLIHKPGDHRLHPAHLQGT